MSIRRFCILSESTESRRLADICFRRPEERGGTDGASNTWGKDFVTVARVLAFVNWGVNVFAVEFWVLGVGREGAGRL